MTQEQHWKRAIIFVDMDAFFASVEKMDRPELRHKAIGVTNGKQGTCLITCSYEARAYGVHTGMRLKEARRLCPDLIQCPARPKRYAEISSSIMKSLQDISPDVEVFSVDEAFIDVSHCQRYWKKGPEYIARLVKKTVTRTAGINCTVAVSGDRTTAKFAAKQVKPDGLNCIPPWRAKEYLEEVPVTDLCGIGKGIGRFLNRYGVYTCGDMPKLPISVLGKRFGNPGRRIWHMCQGNDPQAVETKVAPAKSMSHGKVMPPNTQDRETISTYLMHMSEKLAARLRKNHLQAQHFSVGLHLGDGWHGDKFVCPVPTNNSHNITHLCEDLLRSFNCKQGVYGVRITALDPRPSNQQAELFTETLHQQNRVNDVMDAINIRYGEFTLAPAQLLNRSQMPNVIAPAWKPEGHRQSIPGIKA